MVAPMRTSLPPALRWTVQFWTAPSLAPALVSAVLALTLLLAGCASAPTPGSGVSRPGTNPDRDGPEANPPKDLALVPDAEPRAEAIRSGGPNRPYEVLGRRYVPITQDRPFTERGLASWYGAKFHGKRTASGEVYDMYAMTAAHPTMPLPSYARVRNPANGREVVVRVNDRGPFHPGRIIDLSYTAALKLDLLRGVAPVEVERLTTQTIRAGSWRAEQGAEPQRLADATADAAPSVPAPTPTPTPAPAPAPAPAPDLPALPDVAQANGFWVQLGAFRQRDGAESFQRRVAAELDWPVERLAVFSDAALFRLQAGPYASRDEARGAAERIRSALQLVPVVLERR
jgi:rare lipoprotein A